MVAMNVWPTDAADGSVANEARWRSMARQWLPSGVLAKVAGEMVPSLSGLNVTVQAGAAWVDGHYCELPGSQVLTVTAGPGIVVVRFDPVANTAELLYRAGTIVPTQILGGVWEIIIGEMGGGFLADRRIFVGSSAGREIQYTQITAAVNITATTQAGAQTLINPAYVTYDGTPIVVEFFAVQVSTPAQAGAGIVLDLWDANTDLGIFGQVLTPAAAATTISGVFRRRIVPTAGAHNYNIRAWVTPAGTGIIGAGGGVGNSSPAYLRILRA